MDAKLFVFPKLSVLLRLFLILLSLEVLVSSCTTVQVSQDYDTSFLFGTASTFGWNEKQQQENNKLPGRDELLAKRFRTAVENVLASRGFRLSSHPALLVSYTYTVRSKLRIEPVDSHFSYGFSRYGHYQGIGINTGNSFHQYDQGTLIINIHSAETKQLVWKGTGTREVFAHSNPAELTRYVNEMVEAVLAQFPPLIYPRQ